MLCLLIGLLLFVCLYGCADFIPECTTAGGMFSPSEFEPFSALVSKANTWIRQQQVQVLNVQSIDYKVSHSWGGKGKIDSQRSLYKEHGSGYTHFIRILRVCYVTDVGGYPTRPESPISLSYKTFVPAQISTGGAFSIPNFETTSATMRRVMAWVSATGARVVSAETVPIRMYSGNQHGNHEMTYTWNHGNRDEYWLYVARVYFDGYYPEPPPEALPPLPQIVNDGGCCTIL